MEDLTYLIKFVYNICVVRKITYKYNDKQRRNEIAG